MQIRKTQDLVLTAVFAAVIAVLSQISVPLGFTPVPISLGTIGIFLAAGLLRFPSGIVSVMVYLFLGLVGLPVFANFGSGIGTLMGPTGGFLIGYIAAAFLIGFLLTKKSGTAMIVFSLSLATAAIYLCGIVGFMYSTGSNLTTTLTAAVVPFLPGDAVKIVLCTFPIRQLRAMTIGKTGSPA